MIVSKEIYPTLVDVFYGDEGFKQQEWMRCFYTKKTGWRIASWPVLSNKAEMDYKCVKHPVKMIRKVLEHLIKHHPNHGK